MKRKIIYGLLSVAVAFGLWIYVITTVSPQWEETFYDIPVTLNNEMVLHGNGLMIMEEEVPAVTLRLLGNRKDLVTLNKDNIKLTANLATIYEKGEQQLSYSISFPENIPNNSIEVVNKVPQELTLTVVERKSVQIPVIVDYAGAVPEGYRTDTENVILDNVYIIVSGPADEVDKLANAKISVNLNGQTKTISQNFDYTLHDKNGAVVESKWLTTNVGQVNLTLKIQPFKSVNVGLNIIAGGGVTKDRVTCSWDVDTIDISGPQQALDAIGDTVLVDVDLAKISAAGANHMAQVELEIDLPEDVEIIFGNTTVLVTINFPNDLDAKQFKVANFEFSGLPSQLNVTKTANLTVWIRGLKSELDVLNAENLTLVVDMSNAQVGTDTYKVSLKNEDNAKFGLLPMGGKAYTVSVEVAQNAG